MFPDNPLKTVHWASNERGSYTFNDDDLHGNDFVFLENLVEKYKYFDNYKNPVQMELFLGEFLRKKNLRLTRITETKGYWSYEYKLI